MKHHHYVLAALVALFTYFAFCPAAGAADEDKVIFEVSAGMATPVAETTHMQPQYRLVLGYDWAYTFVTYEEVGFRMLGQEFADGNLTTVGVGTQYDITPDLSLFAEAGIGVIDYGLKAEIAEEVTYTQLVGTHAVDGREIPFEQCYNGADCNRGYELVIEDAPVFRVGVKWEPVKHLVVSFSQRFMTSDMYYRVFDLDRIVPQEGWSNLSWWEESVQVDLNSTEIHIGYKW